MFASRPEVAGRLVRHWESSSTIEPGTERAHLPRLVLFDGPTSETHDKDSVLPNVVNYQVSHLHGTVQYVRLDAQVFGHSIQTCSIAAAWAWKYGRT